MTTRDDTVPSSRRDTRDRMVRTTARLLRQQGYHGTGLNQIAAEAQAPKGSMYFHFPEGKAQLAAEAVDLFGRKALERIQALVDGSRTTADGLVAYLDQVAEGFERVGYQDGCAIATVSAEAAPGEPALADATRRALDSWVDALAERLRAEGHRPAEARRLATTAVVLIEGAIVVARGTQRPDPVRQVRRAVRDLLAPSP